MNRAPEGSKGGRKRPSRPRGPRTSPTDRQIEKAKNEQLWELNRVKGRGYYGELLAGKAKTAVDCRKLKDELELLARGFAEPAFDEAIRVLIAHGLLNGKSPEVAKRAWFEANHREFLACDAVEHLMRTSNVKLLLRRAAERVAARFGLHGTSLDTARAALEARCREVTKHGRPPVNWFEGYTGIRLRVWAIDDDNVFEIPPDGMEVRDTREWRQRFAAGLIRMQVLPKTVENSGRIPSELSDPDSS